jgi:hypothetical protein
MSKELHATRQVLKELHATKTSVIHATNKSYVSHALSPHVYYMQNVNGWINNGWAWIIMDGLMLWVLIILDNCSFGPLSCNQVPQKFQNALNYLDCRIRKHKKALQKHHFKS